MKIKLKSEFDRICSKLSQLQDNFICGLLLATLLYSKFKLKGKVHSMLFVLDVYFFAQKIKV